MISINLIRGENAFNHNFPPYLLPDIAAPAAALSSSITVEFPAQDREQAVSRFCSDFVTVTNLYQPLPEAELKSCLMPANRSLRLVVARRPVARQPYPEQAPQYLIATVIETLECGHSLEITFLPDVEPLIAKRRVCHECQGFNGALPLAPPKKPAQSVRQNPAKKRDAA